MHGQYLDLSATGHPTDDLDSALAIVRYKTAKYTVERPLHIGAVLAHADQELLDALSAFALPLGEAFQLRDDLLGVFGYRSQTGKPILDDLGDGKHTVLSAVALAAADDTQAHLMQTLYGNAQLDHEGAARLRDVLRATGAEQAVERMISDRHAQALTALAAAGLPSIVQQKLGQLADQAVWRST